MTGSNLRRLQWAVRGALTLGVAASVTANILHARPNPISQAIAAWPPLALLLTVELVSRVPVYRRSFGAVRLIATACISAIAAWVSYWHMAGVASRYGETGTSPYLLPLSVDGLIVVASISLMELSNRIRDTRQAATPTHSVATLEPRTAEEHRPPTAPARLPDAGEPVTEEPDEGQPTPTEATAGDPPDDEPTADTDSHHQDDEHTENDLDDLPNTLDVPAELAPLLPAARAARDALTEAGRSVSRDALAAQMRRDGHPVRNNRASELLNVLKQESVRANSRQPASA
jgi:hypothetical protein